MHNSENRQFDNSFLLDEVRCGFYIPTEIKQAWAAQLEVLQAVDAVCRANNIQYFADWGTLLGAVRHRGFIPWDDDLDIVMKREDYEHFRRVENQLPEGYSIHTFRNEEGFREFHATVCGAPSVSFEKEHLRKFHGFPYMCGLDIFILDYVYADEKKEEERVHNIKYVIGIADAIEDGTSSKETIEYGLNEIEKKLNIKLDRKADKHEMWIYLYELAEKLCGEVKPEEAAELTQMIPWGIVGKAFRFPKELYARSIYIPFEYTFMPVPVSYDEMLTKRYGNYMKLVKAAGGHEYPFFKAQKEKLQSLLDFDMPGYRYSEDIYRGLEERTQINLADTNSWKSIVKEALNDWINLINSVNEEITLQQLADAQQLIIDIVNLVEGIKGENVLGTEPVEQCCEILFNLYNYINDTGASADVPLCSDLLAKLNATVDQIVAEFEAVTNRREVIFLSMGPDKWDAFSDFHKAEQADDNTDVYVIPMPVIYKDYDGAALEARLVVEGYPDSIKLVDYTEYQLQLHRPDKIYIQNCFDEYNPAYTIPKEYYSHNLKNNTDKLIYVPWMDVVPFETTERAYANLEYCATMPGVVNADKVIIKDATVAERYICKLTEWSEPKTEKFWNEKIVVSDKDMDVVKAYEEKMLLYFVGTAQLLAAGDDYFVKMRDNLDIFMASSDKIKVTVVENGGLEAAMSEINPNLMQSFARIKAEYAQRGIEWVVDDNSNEQGICHSIGRYIAYYGDAGYLVPEFVLEGKPVMIQKV